MAHEKRQKQGILLSGSLKSEKCFKKRIQPIRDAFFVNFVDKYMGTTCKIGQNMIQLKAVDKGFFVVP